MHHMSRITLILIAAMFTIAALDPTSVTPSLSGRTWNILEAIAAVGVAGVIWVHNATFRRAVLAVVGFIVTARIVALSDQWGIPTFRIASLFWAVVVVVVAMTVVYDLDDPHHRHGNHRLR